MPGRAAHFTRASLRRVMEGVRAAGVRNYRIDISPDGTISIVIGETAAISVRGNSCDDILGPVRRHQPVLGKGG